MREKTQMMPSRWSKPGSMTAGVLAPKLRPDSILALQAGPLSGVLCVEVDEATTQKAAITRANLDGYDAAIIRIAEQLTRHATRWVPHSTAEIEKDLKRIEAAIGDRRALYTNRERTDRLLMLIALRLRGDAEERAWASTIRDWLMSRGGKPPRQRQIKDRKGNSSLRFR